MSMVEKALIALLAVIVIATLWAGPDKTERNYEFMPDMVRSPAYESMTSNPVFGDGLTMQVPPEGTVARGFLPLASSGLVLDTGTEWEKLTKEQTAAWDALGAPWDWEKLDAEARARIVDRGKAVFGAICATCHGQGGAGDGPVTKRGVPPPANLVADANKALSDGRMYRAITAGKGNMAAHAAQVGREDRWKVIRFVRTLQGQ